MKRILISGGVAFAACVMAEFAARAHSFSLGLLAIAVAVVNCLWTLGFVWGRANAV